MSASLFEVISRHRLVPVVEIKDADTASGLAAALADGGLPIVEITLRTEAALSALAKVAAAHRSVTLAAGTVVTAEQVKQAIDAGAQVIVSPGLNTAVVEYCLKHSVPVIPGVCTPSEIEMARLYGLKVLKFFPAEAYGGVRTLKALSGVYRDFRFVPTGGISLQNLHEYLKIPIVAACGGTWIAPTELIDERQLDQISERAREAVKVAQAAR